MRDFTACARGRRHADQRETGKINRFMLITAEVDPTHFPKPDPPQPPEGQDTLTEDQQRAYQKLLKERDDKLKLVQQEADQLNELNGSWYYLVGEDFQRALRPDIDRF